MWLLCGGRDRCLYRSRGDRARSRRCFNPDDRASYRIRFADAAPDFQLCDAAEHLCRSGMTVTDCHSVVLDRLDRAEHAGVDVVGAQRLREVLGQVELTIEVAIVRAEVCRKGGQLASGPIFDSAIVQLTVVELTVVQWTMGIMLRHGRLRVSNWRRGWRGRNSDGRDPCSCRSDASDRFGGNNCGNPVSDGQGVRVGLPAAIGHVLRRRERDRHAASRAYQRSRRGVSVDVGQ